VLRNLPTGEYQAILSRPGAKTLKLAPFALAPGQRLRVHWDLSKDSVAGNLLRNPDFSVRWVSDNAPDYWRYDKQSGAWIPDNVRVSEGTTYRVTVGSGAKSDRRVALQWMQQHWLPSGEPVRVVGQTDAIGPRGIQYVRILIFGKDDPSLDIGSILVEKLHRP
jgi:hypothetical protein